MASFDYSNMRQRDTRTRGARDASSDSRARSVNRLVAREHESHRLPAGARSLARDIVINYEGGDAYLLDLQSKHSNQLAWLPGASTSRTILTIVHYSDFATAKA